MKLFALLATALFVASAQSGRVPWMRLWMFGLKLEAKKGPVAFYTIEHAERPSGN